MDSLSNIDLFVFREKSRTFCGSVKVCLDKLQPEPPPLNRRQLDEKNILALVRRFGSEGCLRHDPDFYVPALISRQSLPSDVSPRNNGSSFFPQENGEPPDFHPAEPLVYLQGRHRLEAARRFWDRTERWWIVNLYSDGMSTS